MEETLIWTREDIVRFTHDDDAFNRSWAWCWLLRHHPEEASRQAARAILDPDAGVVRSGIDAFVAGPTTEGAQALAALRSRGDLPASVRERLEVLDHPERKKKFVDPFEVETERLSRAPLELRRRATEMLRSRDTDDVTVALGALGYQQHEWATDILLENVAWLLTSSDPDIVWDTLDMLRDPRSLPAILAAWVPGELSIAELYARIHRLSRSSSPMPAGIARDAEKERLRSAEARALRKTNPEAAKRGARRLEVRCTACGRTSAHELEPEAIEVLLRFDGAEKQGRKLPEKPIVVCTHCGTANAYEVSFFSQISALGALKTLEEDRAKMPRGS